MKQHSFGFEVLGHKIIEATDKLSGMVDWNKTKSR